MRKILRAFLLFGNLLLPPELFGGDALLVGTISRKSLHLDVTSVDDAETVFILRQVSQPLIDYNASGQIVPSIAKYWTVSRDMKNYDFFLRDDLHFSDGTKLTAYDVAFSLKIVKSSEFNPLRIYFEKISSILVLSEKVVRISLVKPWSGFMPSVASGLAPIFSADAYARRAEFVGSGPYMLSADREKFFLIGNKYYKGVYPPHMPKFQIVTETDRDTNLDIAINSFDRLIQDHRYSKAEVDSLSGSYLMVNPNRAKWGDLNRRLALFKVLILNKKSFYGAGRLELKDLFPKGMPGFDITHNSYNKLMRVLENVDCSILKGEKIVIASPKAIPGFAVLEKSFHDTFGIDLENRVVDVRHALPEMSKDASIDIFAFGWNSIFTHPDASLTPFHILGFQALDQRVEEVIAKVSLERDEVKQNILYRKLASLLIENAFVLPLGQKKLSVLTKDRISMSKYRYRYTLQLSEISESN